MNDTIRVSFSLENNKAVSGVHDIEKQSKKFSCWSEKLIHIESHSNIFGRTNENKAISLLDCLAIDMRARHHSNGDSSFESDIYTHVLVVGDEHLNPEEANIESISFSVGDPYKLFNHMRSFGYINSPRPQLIEALKQEDYTPDFDTDKNPVLAYFNGDFEIFKQHTKLGVISAENRITFGAYGGPDGVNIKNAVYIKIEFDKLVKMDVAFKRSSDLSRFFRFIGGDGLYFENVTLQKSGLDSDLNVVYDNFEWREGNEESSFSTPLLNLNNKGFGAILKSWFEKEDRYVVRNNFYNTYFRSLISSDRLITAANMFDIFPCSESDRKTTPSLELKSIIESLKKHIKHEFDEYPLEKNKLLQSTGYLTRRSLKDHTFDRIEVIRNFCPDEIISELKEIVTYGIKCRNYFVHGSEDKKITAGQMFGLQGLFIQSFEYVYAMSELLECGWSPKDEPFFYSQHRLGSIKRDIEYGYKQLVEITSK